MVFHMQVAEEVDGPIMVQDHPKAWRMVLQLVYSLDMKKDFPT